MTKDEYLSGPVGVPLCVPMIMMLLWSKPVLTRGLLGGGPPNQ
jgi:hypothetical protein